MNILQKCCFRSLKYNRKRTAVTIVGIILSTALITAVACMVECFRDSRIAYIKQVDGDYHTQFSGVSPANLKYFQYNQGIEKIALAKEVGYALLEGSQNPDKPYLYIRAVDNKAVNTMALQLTEGRMPENDTELVIGRHIYSNGGVELQVGDTLVLQMGERLSDGYTLAQHNPYIYEEELLEASCEKTYTIVGIVERPSMIVEPRIAPGYSAFTGMANPLSETGNESYEVYVTYTKKALPHHEQITEGLVEALKENPYMCSVDKNTGLINWELFRFSHGIMNMLYGMAAVAIVIIIVTSVFCIRNSFAISLTEKMKLYGRLSSVGMTRRQQKKMVYYEAAFLACVGIPAGVAGGILATLVLVKVVGTLIWDVMDMRLIFSCSFSAILLAAALSAVTIFLSASRSAGKAAKISPISAIRANDTVREKKRLVCPKWVNRFFGIGGVIAYKNLKRARVKYRTTVISIVVSTSVFIGVYSLIQMGTRATEIYYANGSYQLSMGCLEEQAYEELSRLEFSPGVERCEITRIGTLEVDVEQIPLTKEITEQKAFYEILQEKGEVRIVAIGERGYADYCWSLGVPVEEARDKAIVIADYEKTWKENGKWYTQEATIARYRQGDIIQKKTEEGGGSPVSIPVLMQTSQTPMFMQNRNTISNQISLIVSDWWWESHESELSNTSEWVQAYVQCEDADETEARFRRETSLREYSLNNREASLRSEKSMVLTVAIFLYGFVTVVSMIGITNIFNTVSTNMELRTPEFAMLRAVGMSRGEFGRMIWLEGLFYGGKALLFGIPLGILISFCFHMAMDSGIVADYRLPVKAILTAIAAVFVLLFVVMRYSLARVNRHSLVETIRNENI